jgi:hypothetical protein
MNPKYLPVKICFLILILGSPLCFGQNQKIDSLKSLLPIKLGSEYIDVLFELSRAYDDIDNEMLFKYSSQAFALAMRKGDSARIVRCGRLKAQAFRRLGVMDSAEFLFANVLGVAKRQYVLADQ